MISSESISSFLDQGVLLSPDLAHSDFIPNLALEKIITFKSTYGKPLVLSIDSFHLLSYSDLDVDWVEFDKTKVVLERGGRREPYLKFLKMIAQPVADVADVADVAEQHISTEVALQKPQTTPLVKILHSFEPEQRKIEVKDFTNTFKTRYEFLRKVLQCRPELQGVSSINKLGRSPESEEVSVIGLVYDKITTKSGNILITLEDATGHIRILVNKGSQQLFDIVGNVCLDEVIGVTGSLRDRLIFAKGILFPEISNNTDKKCEDDVYAAFISDIHVGSEMFLDKEFRRFIAWINGQEGDEHQRDIGSKVKYLFVVGDTIDGVGVFPGQEKYLAIKDIREQYNLLASLFKEIRPDVSIILCPGQHDAIRVAEPQPVLDKDFAGALWDLPNLIFVNNPAIVTIHPTDSFEGYNVLMYHGASFHYYIDSIAQLRQNKARDNPSYVLKLLLQKRHLAPSYGSTVYIPTTGTDALVILHPLDIFVCGDMHRSDISHYNNILTINCSCWQSKTDFQEKTGNNPDPCKVPVFSLKTKQVQVMRFDS